MTYLQWRLVNNLLGKKQVFHFSLFDCEENKGPQHALIYIIIIIIIIIIICILYNIITYIIIIVIIIIIIIIIII